MIKSKQRILPTQIGLMAPLGDFVLDMPVKGSSLSIADLKKFYRLSIKSDQLKQFPT